MTRSSIWQKRYERFRANRRGYWSAWLLAAFFLMSLCSELIANDRPVFVWFDGKAYVPLLVDYPETEFGGFLPTPALFGDPEVAALVEEKGWMIWPPVHFSYDTVNLKLTQPAPSPPTLDNPLGTDDQGRDVVARLLYGFRLSLLFGLALTALSSAIGVAAGTVQGYFGGWLDLLGQRFLEIWSGLPQLFILIIAASIVVPSFWTLLTVLLLFSWTALVSVVRAEVLRVRNFDYVRAAKALGMSDRAIMIRHILPNAMVATLTFAPFILSGSVVALTSLDFLGIGMPPGSASLGDLLAQGKNNLQAPWLGLTGFLSLAFILSLMVFVGEAVRDAFDARKSLRSGEGR